jgi:uncharacterized protein
MLILLSPSKSMDESPATESNFSVPEFLDQSEILISELRQFSTDELMSLMSISQKLAELNHQRFIKWETPFTTENAKQALFTFTGNVYDGLNAASLDKTNIEFAQDHLRILSGLYGLLRPLDLIQPYRLEMGRPLKTDHAKNLYKFWRNAISDEINQLDGDLIVNLASQEYSKVIDRRRINKLMINPVFKDGKNGKFKIISTYAKKARGLMANFIIKNQITRAEDLFEFSEAGYIFDAEFSTPSEPTFKRIESARGSK